MFQLPRYAKEIKGKRGKLFLHENFTYKLVTKRRKRDGSMYLRCCVPECDVKLQLAEDLAVIEIKVCVTYPGRVSLLGYLIITLIIKL